MRETNLTDGVFRHLNLAPCQRAALRARHLYVDRRVAASLVVFGDLLALIEGWIFG
jgi:hypothetical protein